MIVELRQYSLRPGRRDDLIALFDREFVHTQEAAGMRVIGQFRDLDDPDRFVWLRAFPDMPSRAAALTAFYTGPTWMAHRAEANATMLDSDNVLLLRPATATPPFPTAPDSGGPFLATLHFGERPFGDDFAGLVAARAAEFGVAPLALLTTEYAENTFPALPVRTGEHVFAWFAGFPDEDALADHLKRFPRLTDSTRHLRLSPTAGSRLR
ncbi:NIPSNAP family protein [Paractinoplanes atraurantiacus]|uniref:Quinol monooxygenase YgiN n=1 Tax=Paractinoplanes atraurantiacus TaxID=1036182 RepID=A0A285KNV7_9ACTN|nr:NIPSNAP family protein [Actinoplanes atraurantiacus]SNY73893.1 Quinol monooxygenase YgiN [Actinoplanes atraurantiacus]